MESIAHEIDALLVSLGRLGRLGNYGEANHDLNKCLLLINQMQENGLLKPVPPGLIKKFNYSLETIFLMLKNKDWVAISDIIEYELIGIWQEIIKAL